MHNFSITFFLTFFLLGNLVFADTNGIWHNAEDIRGGTFGFDEQDVTTLFKFINLVQFDNNLLTKGVNNFTNTTYYKNEEIDNRYVNSNGDIMSGNLTINNRWFVTAHGSSPTSGVGMFGSFDPNVAGGVGIIQAYNYSSGNAKNIILQNAGGNVGIGTTSPTEKLEVNGSIKVQGICIGGNCINTLPTGSSIPAPIYCTGNNALQWNGTNWFCVSIPTGGSSLPTPQTCTGDKALQWTGSSWDCKSFTPAVTCSLAGITKNVGQSNTFYSTTSSTNCAGNSQLRTCLSSGNFDGNSNYQYASCSAPTVTCSLSGITVNQGQGYTFYSTTSSTNCAGSSQVRTCQSSGNFDGSSSYQYASCSAPATSSCSSSYSDVTVTGSTTGNQVWGSNNRYTDDSDISKAAVHAGLISVGQTATIKRTSLGYLSSYTGTTANGITTSSYGGFCGISLSVISAVTCDPDPYGGSRAQMCGTIACGVSAMPSGKTFNQIVIGSSVTQACTGSTFEYRCANPGGLGDDWGVNSINCKSTDLKKQLDCSTFSGNRQVVSSWYKEQGRCPDVFGLNWWENNVNTRLASGSTLTQLKAEFVASYDSACQTYAGTLNRQICHNTILCNNEWKYVTNTNYCIP